MSRLRPYVGPILERVAKPLSRLPAWIYTLAALMLSPLFLYSCSRSDVVMALVLLLIIACLDAVDGAVARIRGEASPRGAFMDSITDRIVDVVLGVGFFLLRYNFLLVYLATVSALLISYIRARYESLKPGSSLEGIGFLERGDRVLLQALILIIHYVLGFEAASIAYGGYVVLLIVTVIERSLRAYKLLL